jgi:hypothetical protein
MNPKIIQNIGQYSKNIHVYTEFFFYKGIEVGGILYHCR